jgi:uncharacterized protein YjiS (DUF1127 family)
MTRATERSPSHSTTPFGLVSLLATGCLKLLARWHDRHLQRADLSSLDGRLLHDIGLSREDVRRECAKPFWR